MSGLTLVELLVVIAIIALLLAVVIAIVPQVRGRADAVVCVSNLRQLHGAVTLYASDNDRQLPYSLETDSGQRWHRLIYPYLADSGTPDDFPNKGAASVYLCVADRTPFYDVLSYGFNNLLNDKKLTDFSYNPILIADAVTPQQAWETFRLLDYSGMRGRFAYRHSANAHAILVDGSVVSQTDFPPVSDTTRKLWLAE